MNCNALSTFDSKIQFCYGYGVIAWMKNSVASEKLASSEARESGSTLFSKENIVYNFVTFIIIGVFLLLGVDLHFEFNA